MTYTDRYLLEDIEVAKKIENDPSYYDKLEVACNYIRDLNIQSDLQFYSYSVVLEVLNMIPYRDTQAFIRFQNQEYYEHVKEKANPKLQKKAFTIIYNNKK